MLKAKSTRPLSVSDIFDLAEKGKLIAGEDVLPYFDVVYGDITQRHTRKTKSWKTGYTDTMISYGVAGGNMVFYEAKSGEIAVIDGRGRIKTVLDVLSGDLCVDPSCLDLNLITPWTVKSKSSCGKAFFDSLPTWARENVLNTEIQVIWLSYKDTTFEEARDLFCRFNSGVQKVNRSEIWDTRYHGDLTALIAELIQDKYFVDRKIIDSTHIANKAANVFVAFLLHQSYDKSLCTPASLAHFFKNNMCMTETKKKKLLSEMRKALRLFDDIFPVEYVGKSIASHGVFLSLVFALTRFSEFKVDLHRNRRKIRSELLKFLRESHDFKGTREDGHKRLSKEKLVKLLDWNGKGHDVDSRALKSKRAEIIRDLVLPLLPKGEAMKVPALFC